MTPAKLLIVDDDETTRNLLREVLAQEGYEIRLENNGESALKAIERETFALVLSDIRMLDVSGLELLSVIKQRSPRTVVILMTGFGSMEGAIESIQKGAFDYISKPFKIAELKELIARAHKHWKSTEERGQRHKPKAVLQRKPKTLIGKSSQILEVYKSIARASMSGSSVLLIGESGTGKELVARAIHENGNRRQSAFVAVNCAAIAETLLESELFGHKKGAFTGANQDKKGLIEEAHKGTLFLDEIGDISPALQVKLLRVLQEGEYKAVGSNETHKADFRLIAATHRDLEALVKAEKFREDLFYRLKVIQIELPPLRERIEDLPELVDAFVGLYSEKNGKSVSHVSDEAMRLLSSYDWPGNVRELEHAVERAVAMTRGAVLEVDDFPDVGDSLKQAQKEARQKGTERPLNASEERSSLDVVERAHILKVLEQTKYNRSKASEILGIDRATLYRKAQKYGIVLGEK